jgi:hypothetical protein
MIKVTLTRENFGMQTDVGSIDFEGVLFARLDGRTRVAIATGKNIPFSYACHPTPNLSRDELEEFVLEIADMLSMDNVHGKISNFEWWADFCQSRDNARV